MTNEKNTQFCKNCGKEIAAEAVMCPDCGTPTKKIKIKKPFYKKWWFWAIVVIIVVSAISSSSNKPKNTTTQNDTETITQQQIEYTPYQVSELVDDLKNNALSAEKKYGDKYVELTGKLSVIDSDGSYISLEPTNNEFNLTNVQCYTQNEEQIDKISEMSKGDIVTLRGKITDVGELMGYQLKIDSIN